MPVYDLPWPSLPFHALPSPHLVRPTGAALPDRVANRPSFLSFDALPSL